MPAIDIVLVSHDHRDHVDLPTLRKLPDTALYVVPAGNRPRLAKPNVVELDWWQTHEIGGLEIALVPARHWSMRMPWNRNATLGRLRHPRARRHSVPLGRHRLG